jgi:hypothetical protein
MQHPYQEWVNGTVVIRGESTTTVNIRDLSKTITLLNSDYEWLIMAPTKTFNPLRIYYVMNGRFATNYLASIGRVDTPRSAFLTDLIESPLVVFTDVPGVFFLLVPGMVSRVSYTDLVDLYNLLETVDEDFDDTGVQKAFELGRWSANVVDNQLSRASEYMHHVIRLVDPDPASGRWTHISVWEPVDVRVFKAGVKAMIDHHPQPYVVHERV